MIELQGGRGSGRTWRALKLCHDVAAQGKVAVFLVHERAFGSCCEGLLEQLAPGQYRRTIQGLEHVATGGVIAFECARTYLRTRAKLAGITGYVDADHHTIALWLDDYEKTVARLNQNLDEARAEADKLKIAASNHAADAARVREERDKVEAEAERLRSAVREIHGLAGMHSTGTELRIFQLCEATLAGDS